MNLTFLSGRAVAGEDGEAGRVRAEGGKGGGELLPWTDPRTIRDPARVATAQFNTTNCTKVNRMNVN